MTKDNFQELTNGMSTAHTQELTREAASAKANEQPSAPINTAKEGKTFFDEFITFPRHLLAGQAKEECLPKVEILPSAGANQDLSLLHPRKLDHAAQISCAQGAVIDADANAMAQHQGISPRADNYQTSVSRSLHGLSLGAHKAFIAHEPNTREAPQPSRPQAFNHDGRKR